MTGDRQFVAALARGLEILDCFSADQPLLTNGELSRMTGLASSSVSRLTHTLVKLGHLDYDANAGAYRIGLRVLSMPPAALAGARAAELQPCLTELAGRLDETALIAVYESYGLLVVQCASATPQANAAGRIGRRYPIPRSAMGRTYVANCSTSEQERILAHLSHGEQDLEAALRGEVEYAISSYRSQGYCLSLGAIRPGNHSIGVTMNLQHLGRRAVLACGGPAHRMPERRLHEQVAPMLMQMASELERACARHTPARAARSGAVG